MVLTGQVTVTSTPTLIHNAGDKPARLTVRNDGTTRIYLGGPNVTVGDGFPLYANEMLTIPATGDSDADLYAVGSTDTVAAYIVT